MAPLIIGPQTPEGTARRARGSLLCWPPRHPESTLRAAPGCRRPSSQGRPTPVHAPWLNRHRREPELRRALGEAAANARRAAGLRARRPALTRGEPDDVGHLDEWQAGAHPVLRRLPSGQRASGLGLLVCDVAGREGGRPGLTRVAQQTSVGQRPTGLRARRAAQCGHGHVQRPRRVLGGRGAGTKRRFTSPSCNPILQPKSLVSVGASWDYLGNAFDDVPANL